MTQKQRMKRKKIYARRRRLIVACVLLLCVGLILLCVALLKIFTGEESTSSGPSRSETVSATETNPPPTTTTTVPAPTVNPTLDSQITATGAVIYDKTAGRLLYSKNGTLKLYPASMTKLLTAITAIEYGTEGLTFTVGTEIKLLGLNSSTAGLEAGDQLTFPMLLDLMMLPSGNDASYVVAAHIGRLSLENDAASDVEAVAEFARMMNETARELGAENSHFTNPDGYHDPEHYSTAEDMLLITQRAMEIPAIRESVVKPKARVKMLSGKDRTYGNSNKLVQPASPYYYEGCIGIKTGSTDEAGACLSAGALKQGREVYVIVMQSQDDDTRYTDAIALLNFAYSQP